MFHHAGIVFQLYAPYGGLRYSSGTMPTAKGFTGQRADAATGLDYYGARYYDAVAGQFTSADTVASGLSPYAYVRGNPETLTDPTGHRYECPDGGCGGGKNPPPSDPGSGNGKGNGSSDPSSGCDKTCQSEANSINDHLRNGLIKIGGALATDTMCFTFEGAACAPWIAFTTPILLDGLHEFLDALDLRNRYLGGQIGDWSTLEIRMFKVVVDILQLMLVASTVTEFFLEAKVAGRFLEGVGDVIEASYQSGKPELTPLGNLISSGLSIWDMSSTGPLQQDIADMNASAKACAAQKCLTGGS